MLEETAICVLSPCLFWMNFWKRVRRLVNTAAAANGGMLSLQARGCRLLITFIIDFLVQFLVFRSAPPRPTPGLLNVPLAHSKSDRLSPSLPRPGQLTSHHRSRHSRRCTRTPRTPSCKKILLVLPAAALRFQNELLIF